MGYYDETLEDLNGKTVTIRDHVFTIVGVTPASFEGVRPGQPPDLTLPLVATMMSV